MKKLSILLLVAALAGGMAFGADLAISGDATFSTSWDLQNSVGGFDAVANTFEYDASIVLIPGGAASTMGEGDVYAVLEVSVDDWEIAVDEATAPALPGIGAISLDTFKIVAPDFEVNLLGASPAGNFAQYFDYNDDDAADIDVAAIGLAGQNGGVDITAGDITVGADFWYNAGATFLVWGAVSAELGEGLTADIAAGYDDAAGADLAAQLAYAADAYAVTVGVDTADNFALYEVEADINATIDIITVDANVYFDGATVYVANNNTVALEDLSIGVDFYWNDLASGNYVGGDVDLAGFVDALDVLKVAGGYDIDTPGFDVRLDLGLVVDAADIDAYVAYDGAIAAGGTLAYALDAGTLNASFDYNNDATIDASVGFESTSIVNGATLALGWAAEDIAADLGDITASVTVSL